MLDRNAYLAEYTNLVESWQFLTLSPDRMGYPLPQKRTGGAMRLARDGSNIAEFLLDLREQDARVLEASWVTVCALVNWSGTRYSFMVSVPLFFCHYSISALPLLMSFTMGHLRCWRWINNVAKSPPIPQLDITTVRTVWA